LVALKECGNRLQPLRLPCSRQSFRCCRLSVSSLLYSQYSSG
jgi:hypothetical protein